MSDPLGIVKELARTAKDRATNLSDTKSRERMAIQADALADVVREVEQLRAQTQPLPRFNGEDISDLPPELLKELNITKTDDIENQLFTLINAAGGEADIDTILIGLFRRFKRTETRRYIGNRLWRMTQKDGVLWSVPGKKGCYTTTEPEGDADEAKPTSQMVPEDYFGSPDEDSDYVDDSGVPF